MQSALFKLVACLIVVASAGEVILFSALSNALEVQAAQWTNEMTLKVVSNNNGAVCLDGTYPGYYFRPAQTSAGKDKWVVFIMGGGWCYNEEDCYHRSKTSLGSITFWGKHYNGTGIQSGDPSINPDFYDWNSAYFIYCDGASFSGNREDPIVVNNTKVFFRGRRVLDALFDDLLKGGMDSASHVILSGCSAGGLSTFLHANYLATKVSKKTVFKALPQSGYFLDIANLDKKPVYPDEMKTVFTMQNSSGGVNDDCFRHTNADNHWHCIFAPHTYPYITVPIFVLNSFYDSWQMRNVLGAQVSTFEKCAAHGPSECTPAQIQDANEFHSTMIAELRSSRPFNDPHNGAFLHSCWTHCASTSDHHWRDFTIGGKRMREAVGDWYFERTSSHVHIDCTMSLVPPFYCNPTCPH